MSRLPVTICSVALLGAGLCASIGIKGARALSPTPVQAFPTYLDRDGIQYFVPGSEFKLSREAAAMKAYRADGETSGPDVSIGLNPDATPAANFDVDIYCEHCLGPRHERTED